MSNTNSNTNSAKKSRSQKRVESEGNDDKHHNSTGNQVSLGTDSSQPDSARRRDPRKRMKKTISAKEYETANMDSQNNSKVDESLGVNKPNGQAKGMYNQIEFQSINGLSESTLPNDNQQFQLGQQKQQSQQITASSNSYQQGQINNQNTNNINNNIFRPSIPNSTSIQMNSGYSEQQQSIVSPVGAVSSQKHVLNIDNVDQNSDSEYDETTTCSQRIKKFLKVLLPLVYLAILVIFTVGYSYQFQIEEHTNEDLPQTQVIPKSNHSNDLILLHGILNEITQEAAESCGIVKSELKRIINQKNSLFQVKYCSWVQSCRERSLAIGGFCVKDCPKGTVVSARKPTMCVVVNSLDVCPISTYLSHIVSKKEDNTLQSIDCQDCAQNCISCSSSEICSACQDEYFLQNGKCIRTCVNPYIPTWVNFTKSHQQLCTYGRANPEIINNYQMKYILSEVLRQRVYYEIVNYKSNPGIVMYYINSASSSFLEILDNAGTGKSMEYNYIMDNCEDCTIVGIHTLAGSVQEDLLGLFVRNELINEVEGELGLQRSSTRAVIGDGKIAGEFALKVAKDNRPYSEFGFIGLINYAEEIAERLPGKVNIPTKLCVYANDEKEKEQLEVVRGEIQKKNNQLGGDKLEMEIGVEGKGGLYWMVQQLAQFKEEQKNSKNH